MTSAELQRNLERSLRTRLSAYETPEYLITPGTWDMPAGLPICRLRASARRTSATACSGWPTPRAEKQSPQSREDFTPNLAARAMQAGWATPNTMEPQGPSENPAQFSHARRTKEPGKTTSNLGRMVHLTGGATPTCPVIGADGHQSGNNRFITSIRYKAIGATNGSSAPTEKPGALNPQFVCWLMGYPPAWDACAVSATPSSPR